MKYIFTLLFVAVIAIQSCSKVGEGISEPKGGLLPTNYIIMKNNSFSPATISAVNGNSFTFVNYSGAVQGIVSDDSILINKQGLADKTSYYFKKDSAIIDPYTINYHLAGKPNVYGTITITP